MATVRHARALVAVLLIASCGDDAAEDTAPDASPQLPAIDAGRPDAAEPPDDDDAAEPDGEDARVEDDDTLDASMDAALQDDASIPDTGASDAGDAQVEDASSDASLGDAGAPDGGKVDAGPPDAGGGVDAGGCTTTLTYANFARNFFASYCVRCHNPALANGGVELDSLANVLLNTAAITDMAVLTDTMPQAGPYPSAAARVSLGAWIDCSSETK